MQLNVPKANTEIHVGVGLGHQWGTSGAPVVSCVVQQPNGSSLLGLLVSNGVFNVKLNGGTTTVCEVTVLFWFGLFFFNPNDAFSVL